MSDEAIVEAAPAAEESSSEAVETEAVEESSNEVSEENLEASGESSSEEAESQGVQAETEEELEQEINEAIEDGATEEEIKDMIREFTLKVNGKEYKRQIDLTDEETLKKELQLAMAGRQAMQENAELKKFLDNRLNYAKDDPFGFLEELGFDPLELAAKRIDEYVRENEKSPEQREEEARQKRFKEIEEENRKLKQAIEEERRQIMMEKAEAELTDEISNALDKYGQLDETPELLAEIADAMYMAMEDGWTDVRAEDVIPSVHERMTSRFRQSLKSLKSKDALKSVLGDDILNSLREERLEQAKKIASVKNLKTDVNKVIQEDKKDVPKINLSDLLGGRTNFKK